jgi:hypothetical protein
VVLAVTCGSLLSLLPHRIVQTAMAVVFLAGARCWCCAGTKTTMTRSG